SSERRANSCNLSPPAVVGACDASGPLASNATSAAAPHIEGSIETSWSLWFSTRCDATTTTVPYCARNDRESDKCRPFPVTSVDAVGVMSPVTGGGTVANPRPEVSGFDGVEVVLDPRPRPTGRPRGAWEISWVVDGALRDELIPQTTAPAITTRTASAPT